MVRRYILWVFILLVCHTGRTQNLAEEYILEWKRFYPSKAEKSGMHDMIFDYENRELQHIQKWLTYNKEVLALIAQGNAPIDPIDVRLLRVQAQSEIDTYEVLAAHRHSLSHYSRLMVNAISGVLQADYLLEPERSSLRCKRLKAISALVKAAINNLTNVPKDDLERGLKDLSKTLDYLNKDSNDSVRVPDFSGCPAKIETIMALQSFRNFANELLVDAEDAQPVLGQKEFDRQLQLYTDSDLTSKKLEDMALAEIQEAKKLMAQVSKEYLQKTYPNIQLPKSDSETIKRALADMEKDAPLNSLDYLEFWRELADAAVKFIEEKNIATLPKTNTLQIQTAPESAGPAARIGWVASAPPFAPNPMTTLNLPSIPESLPKQEQIDFWASFNKPFNRMIVIHELYPGHYMQLKISRETAHPIRLLFPYGIYIEGWATFIERVLLDEGWEKGNHLTFLAHLRKRLENANRSYTSVQVHCNGWSQGQVLKFSTETALLAPQFAKSLWGRIMRSPMQLTSYFLGGAKFSKLLKSEKERLGEKFQLKRFMDTIMKAGPIPIDEFFTIFEQMQPTE